MRGLMPFVDKNSFIKPLYLPESAWHKHAPFAFWLLAMLKPKNVVELGVHNGFSFFIFCQYAKLKKNKCICYAVDHWLGDEHSGLYDDRVFQNFKNHQKLYSNVSIILKGTFNEALAHFDKGSISLLHIDGRHFYDDVKEDFNNWKNKLSKDAIVLFHDTQVKERGFGVHKFWKEIEQEYFLTVEFEHGHGLGILCIGDGMSLNKTLQNFFKLTERQKSNLSLYYKALGNEIHYEYLLKAFSIPYSSN